VSAYQFARLCAIAAGYFWHRARTSDWRSIFALTRSAVLMYATIRYEMSHRTPSVGFRKICGNGFSRSGAASRKYEL
jgi:hypothetical protein